MPPHPSPVCFGQFRLHPTQGLSREEREVRVTPKSLSLLRALVERSGEIVSKEELFRTVWPHSVVTEAALSSCILELRRALHDNARDPSFIETVHRRGYRFLAPCHREPAYPTALRAARRSFGDGPLVGREPELAQLTKARACVLEGSTQVVLVTGEEGIGKTALVEAFLASTAGQGTTPICLATCDEDTGRGDAYRPLLDVLQQLCRSPEQNVVVAALRGIAPTWLAELSYGGTPAEVRALRQRTSGATCRRMQHELRDSLEALTAEEPLVLAIEDLQWCDDATLDWLSWFARNPGRARVLLLVTASHDACDDQSGRLAIEALHEQVPGTLLVLDRLEPGAVSEFLRARLAESSKAQPWLESLGQVVHRHTRGHPAFLDCIAGELACRNPSVSGTPLRPPMIGRGPWDLDLPGDYREAVERRLARLPDPARRVLEAASVAGARFSGAEVAAGAELRMDEVNETLASLIRDAESIRPGPMLARPDGRSMQTYQFLHHVRRRLIRERVPPRRRALMHGRIGRRLEAACDAQEAELAPALAAHFEHEADPTRAVAYLHQAGSTSRRRSAHAVAQRQFRRALALLHGLPGASERQGWEALLRVALGRELIATEGLTDEVEACFARAFELQKELHATPRLVAVLWGLWVFHLNHGPLMTASEIATRILETAQELGDPALLLEAHHAQWGSAMMLGEVNKVLEHTRSGMAVCGARADDSLAMTMGCTLYDFHLTNHHAAVCAGFFSAWADALADRQDVAARSLDAAVTHARDIGHPFTLALTLVFGAGVRGVMEDAGTCRRQAAEGRAIAEDHHFDILRAWACIYEGWAMARLGDTDSGLALMNEGLQAYRHTGMSLFRPFQLALAADVLLRNHLIDDSARCVEEGLAIAGRVGDRLASAELHRLRGNLLLTSSAIRPPMLRAEAELLTARQIALDQGARLYASRASRALERVRGRMAAMQGQIVYPSRKPPHARQSPTKKPA